jgi:hypothetical protein
MMPSLDRKHVRIYRSLSEADEADRENVLPEILEVPDLSDVERLESDSRRERLSDATDAV